MSDLRVSYDKLEESQKNLQTINRELDDVAEHQKDVKGSLGSGDIAHAMDDFANNWEYHRRKIQEKVKSLQELTDKTLEAFRNLDQKLGNAAEGHGK